QVTTKGTTRAAHRPAASGRIARESSRRPARGRGPVIVAAVAAGGTSAPGLRRLLAALLAGAAIASGAQASAAASDDKPRDAPDATEEGRRALRANAERPLDEGGRQGIATLCSLRAAW